MSTDTGSQSSAGSQSSGITPRGPGNKPLRPEFIGAMLVLLILGSVFCVLGIVVFWPIKPAAGEAAQTSLVFASLDNEIRLIILAAIAGALGGTIHSIRSFYWYAGKRILLLCWMPMFVTLPVVGMLMGTLFYLLLRGGLYTSQSGESTDPFLVTSLSGLVGMFSILGAEKLKQIAETLLTTTPKGTDRAEDVKEQKDDDSDAGARSNSAAGQRQSN